MSKFLICRRICQLYVGSKRRNRLLLVLGSNQPEVFSGADRIAPKILSTSGAILKGSCVCALRPERQFSISFRHERQEQPNGFLAARYGRRPVLRTTVRKSDKSCWASTTHRLFHMLHQREYHRTIRRNHHIFLQAAGLGQPRMTCEGLYGEVHVFLNFRRVVE